MPKVKKTKPLRSPVRSISAAEQSRMLMKLDQAQLKPAEHGRMLKKILETPLRIPRYGNLAVRKEPATRPFTCVPVELRALKQWVGWGRSFEPANPKRPIRVCPGQRFIKATIGNAEHPQAYQRGASGQHPVRLSAVRRREACRAGPCRASRT